MSIKNILVLTIIFLTVTLTAKANEHKKYVIPNTEVVPLENSKSGEQYELYIQLPVTYSKNSHKNTLYFMLPMVLKILSYYLALLNT